MNCVPLLESYNLDEISQWEKRYCEKKIVVTLHLEKSQQFIIIHNPSFLKDGFLQQTNTQETAEITVIYNS